ncbi:MAG: aminotransferase class V-fold PLP-dependent enzyme [Pilosibacter sp.]
MDVNKIREDFPLLKNRDIIYLDNAATSQKPACVLDAEKRFYEKYNANPVPRSLRVKRGGNGML